MKEFFSTVVAAVMGMLFCSCASVRNYTCTEKDSGRTLHLNKGDTFTILLKSNATTGYQWKFGTPLYDESVIFLRGSTYIHPEEMLCGAPGKIKMTFVAEGSGRTGVRLIYVRPWEKNMVPAKEYNIMVLVKDGTEDDYDDWKKTHTRRNYRGEVVHPTKYLEP